jgi:hypothetical protein
MKRNLVYALVLILGFVFWTHTVNAGVYVNTFEFDPDEGIFWNTIWKHCVPDLPEGEHVDSVQVQLRARVWASGFYPPALLISDSNVFYANDPDQRVGYLHYPSSSFYNNNYSLTEIQMDWLADDGCADLAVLANSGTYYLDYCRLTVTTSIPTCDGDFNDDHVVDVQDLSDFVNYFGEGDCVGDCLGDFTNDGDIDGSDLFVFITAFERGACPE